MSQLKKSQVLQLVQRHRLVAIVRLDDLSQAVALSLALAGGGIVVQEFTLTNRQALQVVRPVKQALVDAGYQAAVGIGSVRDGDEAQAAIAAEADFLVSPITDEVILQHGQEAGLAVMPGAFSPTEISRAWQSGADVVKVFPARQLGPSFIKDVLAPMPYLQLMPTGGIDLSNIATYIQSGAVALGVGGNLINAAAIKAQHWSTITELAQQYSQAALHA